MEPTDLASLIRELLLWWLKAGLVIAAYGYGHLLGARFGMPGVTPVIGAAMIVFLVLGGVLGFGYATLTAVALVCPAMLGWLRASLFAPSPDRPEVAPGSD